MRHRGLIALVVGLGLPLAAPAASRADDVTFNVPVQLSGMASNVTRGRIECVVHAQYFSSGGSRTTGSGLAGRNDIDPFEVRGTSAEFAFSTNGAYSGTQTVRVTVPPPPQLWIDEARRITVYRPGYVCHVQVATPSSNWYPSLTVPRDTATGQASSRRAEGEAPEWARTRGSVVITGNLTGGAAAR